MFPVEAGQLLFPLSERGQEALSGLINTLFKPSYLSLSFTVNYRNSFKGLYMPSASVVLHPRTDVNSFDTRELFEEVVSPILKHLELKGFLSKVEGFLGKGETGVKPTKPGSVNIRLSDPIGNISKNNENIESLVKYTERAFLEEIDSLDSSIFIGFLREHAGEIFLEVSDERREVLIGQKYYDNEIGIDFYRKPEEYEYYRKSVIKSLSRYFGSESDDLKFPTDLGEDSLTISVVPYAFRLLISDKARVLEKGKGLGDSFWVKFIIPIKKITPLMATLKFWYKSNMLLSLNNLRNLISEEDRTRSELYFKEESSVKYQVAVYEKSISPEVKGETVSQGYTGKPIVSVSGYYGDLSLIFYRKNRLFQNDLYYVGMNKSIVQRAWEATKAVFSIAQKLLLGGGKLEDKEVSLASSFEREHLMSIYQIIGASKNEFSLCLPRFSGKSQVDIEEIVFGIRPRPDIAQDRTEGACTLAGVLVSYMEIEKLDEKDLEDREEEDGYYREYSYREYETPQITKLFDLMASRKALCWAFQALSSVVREDEGELFAEILSLDQSKRIHSFRNNPSLSITVYNSFGTQDWSKGEFPVGADVKFELNSGDYSIHLHTFGKKFSVFLSPFEVTTRRILVSRARRIIHGVFGS